MMKNRKSITNLFSRYYIKIKKKVEVMEEVSSIYTNDLLKNIQNKQQRFNIYECRRNINNSKIHIKIYLYYTQKKNKLN